MLSPDLPFYDDPEGRTLPNGITRVMDAHVHVFPDQIFAAVRNWFSAHAWQIRYQMTSPDLIRFLLDRGVARITLLQYAHKPGMARELNRYMAELCRQFPGRVTGLATCFPGEPEAADILSSAFDQGLAGVKLHAHVQCFDMNSPDMDPICDACEAADRPLVMHVGREPKSEQYRCDPYILCKAQKLDILLKARPNLRICVPHLGFDEVDAYRRLVETHDNLWLDTAMVLTDYFPSVARGRFEDYRWDRIMYGSDYPNIPYAWDRELKWLAGAGLSPEDLDRVLYQNAAAFFGLEL